ncbi:uncharacterized protein LOC106739550 [Alligator mississippiensis]|uniref:uncharacterized protein LOC106739550 n=1 Tax=Alligator mississippiensis TaxID=8496 RepID=UPI002877883C|nr:uncharacterized protein LOC106739550 [Alligator mississippiensis]XP_059584801.1 uncharacterized protein LOC106739550 [Alligator mississippiensis]XP_059584803.1 uncharacterized protein LOC106739550 [Alligator mississippiensis]XP_059584804.1 uncharacterized protein LOC106739550 [Alligator mississippiensis]XP_059584805.1 uncharacterized protein LOC106739550 [Alligator mississippiensis]XP_059584806.1 uncharacterized protein LOC106739550 [Alligator mississippiensis]
MDVTSLYTNIPHQNGIQACLTSLQEQNYNSEYRPKDTTDLIHFILTHNNFTFNNQHFLQMMGTATGTKMAPQYADLFMSNLEEDFLKNCTIKTLLYLRYIDDFVIIWTENLQSLTEFHQKFNNHHPSIQLSLEYSSTNISFLVMISIQNDKIQTTLYKKPTDQHTYLHRTSNHPKHTKKAVIYSQTLIYHRIFTEENTQDCHLINLKKAFTQQGHSSREIDRIFERATRIPREERQYRRKNPTNRTPLVMTHHPSLEPVQKILKQLQPILGRDPILKKILPEPPILAFKQAPNLANLITRSKLPQAQNTPKGSRPCHDKKCKTYQHISTTPTITTPHNRAISIPGSYSCTSRNVIYLIQCTKCPDGRYVGETKQQPHTRMNAHWKSIKDRNTQ